MPVRSDGMRTLACAREKFALSRAILATKINVSFVPYRLENTGIRFPVIFLPSWQIFNSLDHRSRDFM